jgi:hypothetical protein
MDTATADQRTFDSAFAGEARKTEPVTYIPGKHDGDAIVSGYRLGTRSPSFFSRADMIGFALGLIITIGPLFAGMMAAQN